MKTLLFTGATGYLGSNILKAIIDKYDKIIILKRSFSNTFRIEEYLDRVISYNLDEIDIEQVFLENKVDMVIHCATDYGRKNISRLQVIEANLILPVKLLEFGTKHGVKCFINTDTILDKRVSHYSLSKKQFDDWLISYKKDIICINIALEHFYGPGDDKTKFVSFILDKLINRIDNIDLTEGEQKRDFIYIDDVANAFLTIIEHSKNLENNFYEFEIGSETEISIKNFVVMMKKLTNNKNTFLNFGALPYRENEQMECVADVTQIKKLGWKINYSLEDGLKKMIAEELKNVKNKI